MNANTLINSNGTTTTLGAQIEWLAENNSQRLHDVVQAIADRIELTDEQLDDIWMNYEEEAVIYEHATLDDVQSLFDDPRATVTTGTPATVAAKRHLIGLSQAELAEELSVNRHTVKDWESGRFAPRPSVMDELDHLVEEHSKETAYWARQAAPVKIDGNKPRGWYTAIAARLTADNPDAIFL